jgi:hypothetical protein
VHARAPHTGGDRGDGQWYSTIGIDCFDRDNCLRTVEFHHVPRRCRSGRDAEAYSVAKHRGGTGSNADQTSTLSTAPHSGKVTGNNGGAARALGCLLSRSRDVFRGAGRWASWGVHQLVNSQPRGGAGTVVRAEVQVIGPVGASAFVYIRLHHVTARNGFSRLLRLRRCGSEGNGGGGGQG